MAKSSRAPKSARTIMAHPDFNHEWCRKIFDDPSIEWPRRYDSVEPKKISGSMFEYTLYSERGIRAHLSFRRSCHEPDSISELEDCFLISVGDGLDGKTGRAHGGFDSLVLDHISGHCAHHSTPGDASPATASMNIDFKRPVSTPCVVFARSWLIETKGRKVWVKAVMENQETLVYARAKTLFIAAKSEKL